MSRAERSYQDAKERFESYLFQHAPVTFLTITGDDHERAAHDPLLQPCEELYGEAIELSRSEGMVINVGVAMTQLGMLHHLQGRFEIARREFLEALTVKGMAPAAISSCHYHLGVLALREGAKEEAWQRLQSSLAIDTVLNDATGIAITRAALDALGPFEGTSAPAVVEEQVPPPAPADETPATLPASTTDVVWLLSYSRAANDDFMGRLRALTQSFDRRLVVSRAAFESATEPPPPIEHDQRLSAAILVIEPQALTNEQFIQWANWCMHRVSSHAEFRLFAHVAADVDDHSDLLLKLRETIHTTAREPDELLRHLRAHLAQVPSSRQPEVRSAVGFAARLLGRVAEALEIFAVSAVMYAAILVLLHRTNLSPALFGTASGVATFVAWIPFIFVFTQQRETPHLRLAAPGLILIAWLTSRLMPPTSWVTIGVALGVMLDSIRRSGRIALSQRPWRRDVRTETHDWRVAAFCANLALRSRAGPFECPMLPPTRPKAFISYTPAAWSRSQAAQLHARVSEHGGVAFLDTVSNPEGKSWQDALDDAIAEADVFVSIVETETMKHEWVAAEWMMAFRRRAFGSLPRIIIVRHPSDCDTHVPGSLPIFRALFMGAQLLEPNDDQPQIIEGHPGAIDAVASLMRPHGFRRPALLPAALRLPLNVLTSPAALLAAFAAPAGVFAAFVAIFEHAGKISAADALQRRGFLAAAFLLAAFWLGANLRFMLISQTELRRHYSAMSAILGAIPSIAFLSLLVMWWPRVPPLIAAWGVIAAWSGWLIAWSYFVQVSIVKPELAR